MQKIDATEDKKTKPKTLEEIIASISKDLYDVSSRIGLELMPPAEELGDEEHPDLEGEFAREHRTLTTKLTREEVEAKAQELAETNVKQLALQNFKAAFADGLKTITKILEANASATSGLVRRKQRTESVQCSLVLTKEGLVNVIRLDSSEVVEKRKPRGNEGQMQLAPGGVPQPEASAEA